jgi:hypothetical protein
MTATTSLPTPPPQPSVSPARPPRNRRSRTEEAEIVRAKKTALALPQLLAGIAAYDANAAKVRIDQAWLDQYESTIAAAEAAADGRAIARVDLRAATAEERSSATKLAKLLIDVRDRVATHGPDDVNAQKAYGRGAKISPKSTGATLALAGSFLQAWDGKWKTNAADAGVTQAAIDEIRSLRDSLSSADMGQHGIVSANTDGTLQRGALFAVLRSMSAFAVRVVKNVFGGMSSQTLSLSDPRPLTNRGAARKAAKKAAAKAKKATAEAKKAAKPKKAAAAAKRRAKRSALALRKAAVTAAAKPATATKPAGAAHPKQAKRKKRG